MKRVPNASKSGGYLENLDVLLDITPLEQISMRWEKTQYPDTFVADVETVRLFIAVDSSSGVLIIGRIERHVRPVA